MEDIQSAIFGKSASQEESDLQNRKLKEFCDDCEKTFSTAHGERVFWFLMDVSRVFQPLPDHGVWSQRAEGMRMIGLLLLSGIGFGHDYGHLAHLNRSISKTKLQGGQDDRQ